MHLNQPIKTEHSSAATMSFFWNVIYICRISQLSLRIKDNLVYCSGCVNVSSFSQIDNVITQLQRGADETSWQRLSSSRKGKDRLQREVVADRGGEGCVWFIVPSPSQNCSVGSGMQPNPSDCSHAAGVVLDFLFKGFIQPLFNQDIQLGSDYL